jgi:hypothetical protein
VSEVNPYESPGPYEVSFPAEVVPESVAPNAGLWRDGKLLVMHRQAALPDRCVKSNQPAHGRCLRRKLAWHHPAIYLLILVAVLIYIIVAVALTKRATIFIGLSEEWFARRRRAILIAWGLVLSGIALMVAGVVYVDRFPPAAWLIALGPILFLVAAIWGIVRAQLVTPTRITNEHIWLKGVHPAFLAELPPLPREW